MPPRMTGQIPTKKYWAPEVAQAVHEMKLAGLANSEIGRKVGKTTTQVRNLVNRHNPFPQIGIPLAEREKGLTAKRCRKCLEEKPLADFAVNFINRVERRWPYCKPCEIARLADRREKGLHLEKTRRHIAKHREKYPEQAEANQIFGAAIRHGRIIRPDTCELCGKSPPRNRLGRSAIQGHHDDYSKPLEVRWFCQPCHITHHKNLAAITPTESQPVENAKDSAS